MVCWNKNQHAKGVILSVCFPRHTNVITKENVSDINYPPPPHTHTHTHTPHTLHTKSDKQVQVTAIWTTDHQWNYIPLLQVVASLTSGNNLWYTLDCRLIGLQRQCKLVIKRKTHCLCGNETLTTTWMCVVSSRPDRFNPVERSSL